MGERALEVAADPAKEHAFREADRLLLDPPRVQQKSVTLLVTVAAYLAASLARGGDQSFLQLAIIVGVLFVHELGHAAGMLLFGYTDVRIFFIPLFGAAAAGRRRGVARWKQGIVLLLGPVPGLIAGLVLFAVGVTDVTRTIALMLVIINGFNLIPVAPFDGGQLFQLVLFSRRRRAELGFLVVAGLALLAGALALRSWIFGLLGYFILITLPMRAKVLAAGQRLRAHDLPEDPAALDEAQRRRLFDDLWSWMPPQWRSKPRLQASALENMLELATRKPPSLGLSVGLLAAWLASVGIAVLGVFAIFGAPPAAWDVYHHRDPDFSIELPARPRVQDTALIANRGKHREYDVVWRPHEAPANQFVTSLGAHLHGTVVRQISSGETEAESVLRGDLGTIYIRVIVVGPLELIASAAAPDDEPDSARVVQSLRPGAD